MLQTVLLVAAMPVVGFIAATIAAATYAKEN